MRLHFILPRSSTFQNKWKNYLIFIYIPKFICREFHMEIHVLASIIDYIQYTLCIQKNAPSIYKCILEYNNFFVIILELWTSSDTGPQLRYTVIPNNGIKTWSNKFRMKQLMLNSLYIFINKFWVIYFLYLKFHLIIIFYCYRN